MPIKIIAEFFTDLKRTIFNFIRKTKPQDSLNNPVPRVLSVGGNISSLNFVTGWPFGSTTQAGETQLPTACGSNPASCSACAWTISLVT